MEEFLRAEHLHKVFSSGAKKFTAVDDVSLSLKQGEKLAIIGESGSGKTTVARIIARLIEPDGGRIILGGKDITKAKGRELRQVYDVMQMVFQNPVESFDPRWTLGDSICEGLMNHGYARKEADKECRKLLQMCGLEEDFARRYPYEVSGGQCQRAAIARALALGPKLLILDEATSALDVTVQVEVLSLLDRLHRKLSMSYLFICHDIALVQDFCHRVMVMYQGKVVEEGTCDQVISNPQQEYTKRLIDSVLQ